MAEELVCLLLALLQKIGMQLFAMTSADLVIMELAQSVGKTALQECTLVELFALYPQMNAQLRLKTSLLM